MANGTTSFTFGTQRAAGDNEEKVVHTFPIDGIDFEVRALSDAVPALVIHQIQNAKGIEVISHVLDFMELAMTKASAKRFADMALGKDGGTGLQLDQIIEVFKHVLGVVGANPTGLSSDSSRPRRKTGSGSTAPEKTTP